MQTITLTVHVAADGRLQLDIPAGLPPGPAEVVVVIQPAIPAKKHSIRELRGLGKGIWEGVDAQEWVNRLRDEWERP